MKARAKWAVGAGIATVAVGLVVGGQAWFDSQVERLLLPHAGKVERGWGKLVAYPVKAASAGAATVSASRIEVESRFLRRTCRGALTWGLGARVEVVRVFGALRVSSPKQVSWQAERVCFDVSSEAPWQGAGFEVTQGKPVALSGVCAPEVSDLSFVWAPPGKFHAELMLSDRSGCLKKLAFLAPQYPEHLVPTQVHVELDSNNIALEPAKLEGGGGVALLTELSRRLKSAEVDARVEFSTVSGERAVACFRKVIRNTHADFSMELGMSEQALERLTAPFVSQDNRATLRDLRTDDARCDMTGKGLFASSDLHEVRLKGRQLDRLTYDVRGAPGLRTSQCHDTPEEDCAYQFGVIQFGPDGKLLDPIQLEAAVRGERGDRRRSTLLLAFLHGWRHSAQPNDTHLGDFERLVEQTARAAYEAAPDEPTRVMGVYLSWPGRLYDSFSANKLLTFWDRLNVARRLGDQEGDLEHVLRRLSDYVHERRDDERPGKMVALAHSMGADPLLTVLARSTEEGDLADLAVIFNPAVSVARYTELWGKTHAQTPPLIAYGSTGDQVNQQLFPLGEALTFNGHSRTELSAHTTTITNSTSLITHRLRVVSPESEHLDALPRPPVLAERQVGSLDLALCRHQSGHKVGDTCGSTELDRNSGLDVLGAGRSRVLVAVDDQILPGHEEFFTVPLASHVVDVVLAQRNNANARGGLPER